ncbi:substrate-binding periplasmic protein [Pontivivens ytuae]|uniref:Transporter substrate-binding domain-containing protein n=1 Tax=Pontivivens ytuae TaxID=2789856 RepID=A0A7S9LS09_9RHOB|nr:transporter substrate-binding domain-containing protein [Pontivivens ytuae]QPH54242.1 transporter substrate-binding domain-containing protein [Pontivivens ytuae]
MLRIALTLATLLLFGSVAGAQTIRVFTSTDLDPMARGTDMDPPGFSHELIHLLADRAGLTLDLVYQPWERAQQEVQNGADAYLLAPTRNARREELYAWIVPILEVEQAFLSTGPQLDSLEAARDVGSIAARGNYERILQGAAFDNVQHVETDNALRMLEAGRIDAVFTLRERAVFMWRDFGFEPDRLVIGDAVKRSTLWLAGPKDADPEITRRLATALAELQADGTYDALRASYFGGAAALQTASE